MGGWTPRKGYKKVYKEWAVATRWLTCIIRTKMKCKRCLIWQVIKALDLVARSFRGLGLMGRRWGPEILVNMVIRNLVCQS